MSQSTNWSTWHAKTPMRPIGDGERVSLDASVALTRYLNDEYLTVEAERGLSAVTANAATLLAPHHIRYEVASA
jgi:hypothetical protein